MAGIALTAFLAACQPTPPAAPPDPGWVRYTVSIERPNALIQPRLAISQVVSTTIAAPGCIVEAQPGTFRGESYSAESRSTLQLSGTIKVRARTAVPDADCSKMVATVQTTRSWILDQNGSYSIVNDAETITVATSPAYAGAPALKVVK